MDLILGLGRMNTGAEVPRDVEDLGSLAAAEAESASGLDPDPVPRPSVVHPLPGPSGVTGTSSISSHQPPLGAIKRKALEGKKYFLSFYFKRSGMISKHFLNTH